MKNLLKISLIFLVLVSCSLFQKKTEPNKINLERNLKKWENFQITGIAEINYKLLTLRKNIFIKKTNSELILNIFDKGIFALTPKPFLSLKIDDKINYDFMNNAKELSFKEFNKKYNIDIEKLLGFKITNLQEILDSYETNVKNTQIDFNQNYNIKKISNDKIKIFFEYKFQELEKINFILDDKNILTITVDEFIEIHK